MAAALLALAVALAAMAHFLAQAIVEGAPGWLNLAVLVFAWDSIKIGLLGSVVVARRALSTVCQARYRGDPRDPAAAIDPAGRRTETLASLCPEQT